MDRLIALVGLRFKTDLRALFHARERLFGLLVGVPIMGAVALGLATLAALGLSALGRAQPEALLPVVSGVVTLLGLFWALAPLLTGVALTEAHDVSRLLHFPVPSRVLVASSLLANLLQPAVLAEAPLLLACALALSRHLALFPLTLLCLLLAFAFVLCLAHLVGLVLHGLARNRRFHDLALSVGIVTGFLLSQLPFLFLIGAGPSLVPLARRVLAADPFAYSPFAWGARAAVHAGRGELLLASAWMLAAVVATGAVIAAAAALVERIERGDLDLGSRAQTAASARARMPLPGVLGALVEKELRVASRDPALRTALLVGFLGPLFLIFFFYATQMQLRGGLGLLALASLVGLSTFGANALGFERRGIALLLGFPADRFLLLLGKNLAALVFRLPGLLTFLLAVLVMSPPLLPAAAVIVLLTLLLCAGADNYLSILFPIPAPAPGRNPHSGAQAGGRGLGGAILGSGLMFGALLLTSPFTFLAWLPLLLGRPNLSLVSLPLALAGAAAVYAMLLAGAARLLVRREPEVLERILGES